MNIAASRTATATDPALLPISKAAALIAAHKLSSRELVTACLDRVAKFDGQVHAFVTLTAELALKQATQADAEISAGHYRGPMHGVPFALKDIFDTAGILTTAHSRILKDNVPTTDATTVSKLYAAGGALLGKLASHEFAHAGPSFELPWPPARNPWNDQHIPGGSSSGSGAAVAAGFVPAALGSDTGGSIRAPSSLCGISGLKPTYGLVSRAGVIPNSYSIDACGPMTWTAEDCAILLQAIAGHDPRDPASANVDIPDYRSALRTDLKGMRIGVLRHFWEGEEATEAGMAVERAVEVLSSLGATLETARLSPMQNYRDVKVIIAEAELFAIHLQDLRTRPQDFSSILRNQVLSAMFFSSVDYVEAQRERRRLMMEMEPVYRQFDALITTGPGAAPRFDAQDNMTFWKKPRPLTVFNVLAGPAIAQCVGFSKLGLPLAMQIASRPFNESAVMRIAHAYEQATPWRERRPQLSSGTEATSIPQRKVLHAQATDENTRELVRLLTKRFDLQLDQEQFAHLCQAAPHALAMTARVRRRRERSEEPASVFGIHTPAVRSPKSTQI